MFLVSFRWVNCWVKPEVVVLIEVSRRHTLTWIKEWINRGLDRPSRSLSPASKLSPRRGTWGEYDSHREMREGERGMGSEKNILLDSDKELAKQNRAFPPMCQSLLHHSMEQYELPGHTAPMLRYALSISTTRREKTGFSFSLLKRFFRHDIRNVFLKTISFL